MNFSTMLEQAQKGNEAALKAMLGVYGDLPTFIRAKMGKTKHPIYTSDDILQLTLVEIHKKISSFRGENQAQFHSWVRAIANSRIQDLLRHIRRQKRGGDDVLERLIHVGEDVTRDKRLGPLSAQTPSRIAVREEDINEVRKAILQLSEKQRTAIERIDIAGEDPNLVADDLGVTLQQLRSIRQGARKHLRQFLGKSSLWNSRYG